MDASEHTGPKPKYKRIILKLSGEVLRNAEDGEPIDANILTNICKEVKKSTTSVSKSASSLVAVIFSAVSAELK